MSMYIYSTISKQKYLPNGGYFGGTPAEYDFLNAEGANGWALCAVVKGEYYIDYYFKKSV